MPPGATADARGRGAWDSVSGMRPLSGPVCLTFGVVESTQLTQTHHWLKSRLSPYCLCDGHTLRVSALGPGL